MKLAMRYTHNFADAEDAVQDIFMRAYWGLRHFRGDSAFYSWLHRIEFDPQMPSEDGIKYPICIDGARHCPPEDVGGVKSAEEGLADSHDDLAKSDQGNVH